MRRGWNIAIRVVSIGLQSGSRALLETFVWTPSVTEIEQLAPEGKEKMNSTTSSQTHTTSTANADLNASTARSHGR